MIFKTFLLLCVGLSVGYRLQSKVDELQTTMAAFDESVNYLAHEASISLRALSVPISLYSTDAHNLYLSNMTQSNQLYWNFAYDAAANATEKGLDIDRCLQLGNIELYVLMDALSITTYNNIQAVATEAENKLNEFYGPARDEPLQHIADLWVKVNACDNDTCAVDLIQLISDDFEQLDAGISQALSDAQQYVLVDYPTALSQYNFDEGSYAAALNIIFDTVNLCISTLGR